MDFFKKFGIKTMLPMFEGSLPDLEEEIKWFLDAQPLQDGEVRAGVVMFKSENGNVLLALVAFNEEFCPVRQMARMPILEFIKMLLNQVKQEKK